LRELFSKIACSGGQSISTDKDWSSIRSTVDLGLRQAISGRNANPLSLLEQADFILSNANITDAKLKVGIYGYLTFQYTFTKY